MGQIEEEKEIFIAMYKGYLIFKVKGGYEIKNSNLLPDDHRAVVDTVKDAMEIIDENGIMKYLMECE